MQSSYSITHAVLCATAVTKNCQTVSFSIIYQLRDIVSGGGTNTHIYLINTEVYRRIAIYLHPHIRAHRGPPEVSPSRSFLFLLRYRTHRMQNSELVKLLFFAQGSGRGLLL